MLQIYLKYQVIQINIYISAAPASSLFLLPLPLPYRPDPLYPWTRSSLSHQLLETLFDKTSIKKLSPSTQASRSAWGNQDIFLLAGLPQFDFAKLEKQLANAAKEQQDAERRLLGEEVTSTFTSEFATRRLVVR